MELIVGALAAWGLIMLLWTLAGLIALPLKPRDDIELYVFVRGKGAVPALPRYIKALLWLRNLGLLWWHVAVVTDELDKETLMGVDYLLKGTGDTSLVSIENLKDWMEELWT